MFLRVYNNLLNVCQLNGNVPTFYFVVLILKASVNVYERTKTHYFLLITNRGHRRGQPESEHSFFVYGYFVKFTEVFLEFRSYTD